MTPFLNCNIWAINAHPYNDFYLVESIYHYNSLTHRINKTHNPACFQIPEFEIKNLHLLNEIDLSIVNSNCIPIISRSKNSDWEINLSRYNTHVKNISM
jgi:hypothetical protein